jgi:glucose/arabinose dehydrogenase
MTPIRLFPSAFRVRARPVLTAFVLAAAVASAPQAQATTSDTLGATYTEDSGEGTVEARVVATGIRIPSTLGFLPNGDVLVADRFARTLYVVSVNTGTMRRVRGLPPVWVQQEGREDQGAGIHHVQALSDIGNVHRVLLSYTAVEQGGTVLALDELHLSGDSISARRRVYRSPQPLPGNTDHFGGRFVVRGSDVWLTYGDRFSLRDSAQSLTSPYGKVLRLRLDGTVPGDNPFAGRRDHLGEVWSYGHRNPQGLAVHPVTGELWSHEHGPKGGDEINIIRKGANFGWPRVTYGEEYEGGPVSGGARGAPGLEDPVYYFKPSIAPSDMVFHTGRSMPAWRGNLFLGAMGLRHLSRLVVGRDRVLHEERLLLPRRWRVRALAEGPDGALYLGVDQVGVVRVRLLGRR